MKTIFFLICLAILLCYLSLKYYEVEYEYSYDYEDPKGESE